MKGKQIARPYAKALFELAHDQGKESVVDRNLGEILRVWNEASDFKEFMLRPQVTPEIKYEVFRRVLGNRLDELIERFIKVVMDKGREHVLPEIYDEFRKLWNHAEGVIEADVEYAAELSEPEQDRLTGALTQATGRRVKLKVRRNPALLAGLVVRMGDRVWDGSMARQLARLGERLRSGDRGGNIVEY